MICYSIALFNYFLFSKSLYDILSCLEVLLQLCQNHNNKKFMGNIILMECLREVSYPGRIVLIIVVGRGNFSQRRGYLIRRESFISGPYLITSISITAIFNKVTESIKTYFEKVNYKKNVLFK